VATAKPGRADRARVPHHLVDCFDPREDFTLARFVESAERAIEQIAGRGSTPVLVGGTGMYLRGLLRGIVPAPAVDARLRARLRGIVERRGAHAVHRWLARVDPDSARRLPPADVQRVTRALEWFLASGSTWSATLRARGSWRSGRERYRCLKLGLAAEPAWLERRLEARVERFFSAGLVDEVRRLLDAGVPAAANALKAIGYREIVAGLAAGADEEEMRARVVVHTRRYAKRQRTWFRGEPGVEWIAADLPRARRLERALAAWDRYGCARGKPSGA